MAEMKILAVDDSPTMRRIIINTLKRAGYNDVIEAEGGREALAKMKVEKSISSSPTGTCRRWTV